MPTAINQWKQRLVTLAVQISYLPPISKFSQRKKTILDDEYMYFNLINYLEKFNKSLTPISHSSPLPTRNSELIREYVFRTTLLFALVPRHLLPWNHASPCTVLLLLPTLYSKTCRFVPTHATFLLSPSHHLYNICSGRRRRTRFPCNYSPSSICKTHTKWLIFWREFKRWRFFSGATNSRRLDCSDRL